MTVVQAGTVVLPGAPPGPGGPPAPAPAVRFVGERRAYWRLLVRGAVLLAVTLGIYRFWFATDVRRFLWSNTDVGGETLEYTGTALELLIGFLIAIAIMVPLYLGFFVAALSLGPVGQAVSTLSFPILAFLGQFAVYRARRYRLTRTIYRGVRCHQRGSAWRYAICAMFWWVMIALTLGLAYPFAQASLERFKLRNTYYGNLQGQFAGSGFSLFLRGLPMWLAVIGPLLLALAYSIATVEWDRVLAAAASATDGKDFMSHIEDAFPAVYAAVVVLISAFTVSLTLVALLFPVFQALLLRWWLGGLRFGALSIGSHLRTGQIYGAYLRFLWYGLLFLIAAALIGGAGLFAFGAISPMLAKSGTVEAVGVGGGVAFYVMIMLGFSTIYQGTIKLALWRCSVESLELAGLSVLDQVKAEGAPSSAVGEGLADALNVGGI